MKYTTPIFPPRPKGEKEIKITRSKLHEAITFYGLGGSKVILDNLMDILERSEHDNDNKDTTSADGALGGGFHFADGCDGEKQKHVEQVSAQPHSGVHPTTFSIWVEVCSFQWFHALCG